MMRSMTLVPHEPRWLPTGCSGTACTMQQLTWQQHLNSLAAGGKEASQGGEGTLWGNGCAVQSLQLPGRQGTFTPAGTALQTVTVTVTFDGWCCMLRVQEMCLNTPQEARNAHGVKCKCVNSLSLTEEPVCAFCKICSVPLTAMHFAVLCPVLCLFTESAHA
jgi:hypothetical protein